MARPDPLRSRICRASGFVSAIPGTVTELSVPSERRISSSGATDVDVVVIGGGVNGTGVARDAAMRGLRVALFERHDLAFGASGNSSGMIHGGGRYLTSDPHVTETSCRDSGHIQAIAPHLLFRIPFLVPVRRGRFAWVWGNLFDGFFEAYDRYQPLKRGKKHVRLTAEELAHLEPGLTSDLYSGVSFDEWGIDGARLCVANAVDAFERDARVLVGCTVERIERDDTGAVRAVHYRDRRTKRVGRISTEVVVNASGAWAPITAALGDLPTTSARVRPGKGIHVVFDRRLSNFAIMAQTIDNRQIFLEPWQNVTVLGTTDDDYYGDLDQVVATSEEVRYLIQAIARVFPAVRQGRIIGTFAGVRPTLYDFGPLEDNLSRDHEIVDHRQHGADGMYSMIGGKLASYRLFAEEMVDILARRFGLSEGCRSHCTALPGGDVAVDSAEVADELSIDAVAARRLVYRHGSRVSRIAQRMKRKPSEACVVCRCEPVLEAEVRYCLEHEFARSVADVARRTRLGLGPCGGMGCVGRCGQLVAEHFELSPTEGWRETLQFMQAQARSRAVALGPEQARQEAIVIANLRAQLGLKLPSERAFAADENDASGAAGQADDSGDHGDD